MQLIAFHSSKLLAGLKWAAAGASALVGIWLGTGDFAPAGWLAALAALSASALALRVPEPDCRLRLRREGWCELFDAAGGQGAETGARGREMVASGAFEGAGWLVLRLRERGGGSYARILETCGSCVSGCGWRRRAPH